MGESTASGSPEVMSVSEYRKKVFRETIVPSGMRFTIKKIPATLLLETMSSLPTGASTNPDVIGGSPEFRKALPNLLKQVLPACCVKPKVSLTISDDETLQFDELEPNDVFHLLTEIMEFSGLTGPAAEARRSFRAE